MHIQFSSQDLVIGSSVTLPVFADDVLSSTCQVTATENTVLVRHTIRGKEKHCRPCFRVKSRLSLQAKDSSTKSVPTSVSANEYEVNADGTQTFLFSIESLTLSPKMEELTFRLEFSCDSLIYHTGDPLAVVPFRTNLPDSAELFNSDETSDVSFTFGGGTDGCQDFRGHRHIILTGSPVLKKLMTSLPVSPDGKKANIAVVPITGQEWMAFTSLMRFVYCGEIVIHSSFVAETLKAAEYFHIPEVVFAVAKLIDGENIVSLLNYTYGSQKKRLAAACMHFVRRNVALFHSSKVFNHLTALSVKAIIDEDIFGPEAELLWNNCVQWSLAECERSGIDGIKAKDQRSVMSGFLSDIPFERMSPLGFTTGAAASGILTMQESNDVQVIFHSRSPSSTAAVNMLLAVLYPLTIVLMAIAFLYFNFWVPVSGLKAKSKK